MDDDAVKFLFVGRTHVLGIRAHGVEGDEEVAADFIALCVVKGNDVGVIIVLEELAIDLQNLFIVHKDVGNGATTLTVRLCHGKLFFRNRIRSACLESELKKRGDVYMPINLRGYLL
mgnify:CR=1 FL=1